MKSGASHSSTGTPSRVRRYRWTFADWLLFSIPVAAIVLTAIGTLLGWAP